ncbi:MAG: hypothetical protein GEU86_22095 [Actinophytocola sp.]|nr:hypothetical protein [Actinophytocola sp.]
MSVLGTLRHKAQQALGSIQKTTGKTVRSTRQADRGRARRGTGKVKQAGSTLRNKAKRATRLANASGC